VLFGKAVLDRSSEGSVLLPDKYARYRPQTDCCRYISITSTFDIRGSGSLTIDVTASMLLQAAVLAVTARDFRQSE